MGFQCTHANLLLASATPSLDVFFVPLDGSRFDNGTVDMLEISVLTVCSVCRQSHKKTTGAQHMFSRPPPISDVCLIVSAEAKAKAGTHGVFQRRRLCSSAPWPGERDDSPGQNFSGGTSPQCKVKPLADMHGLNAPRQHPILLRRMRSQS